MKDSVENALSVYEVFDDVLQQLEPTHILTQTQCEVCAVSLRDLERSAVTRLRSRPKIIALQPNSLDDIWADMRAVARSIRVDPDPAIQTLQARMTEISRKAYLDAYRPRVACIEWLEPLMSAGNWVPQLVEMANGENLFGKVGQHSPWLTWQELTAADPDVIVAMPCGWGVERAWKEMHWLTDRAEWSRLRAVRKNAVFVADGNQFFNRPGPRIVESLGILNEIFHGGPDRQLQNEAYRLWSSN